MNKQLTIEVGTLLEITPGVKQGLVAATRGKSGNPAQGSQRPIPTMLTTVGHEGDDKKHAETSERELLPKTVHLAQAQDGLMKVRVYIGETVATAIIDTGLQLNLISDWKFWESGLVQTEESMVLFTGASGGGNTCIGTITGVEVLVSANKLRTMGPDIHVLENPLFQALLGRPWLTLNGISIEERPEGTYI